jgi:hypothetical protein
VPSTSLPMRAPARLHTPSVVGGRSARGAPPDRRAQAQADGATGQISLFKALAGGWEEAPEGEDRTLLAS